MKLLRGVMTGLLKTFEKVNSPGVYDAVSTQTARKAAKRADRARKTKESGLWTSATWRQWQRGGQTYLRVKCGRRSREGRRRKAGKVMRLKTPTTSMEPNMDEAKMLERFCGLR
jgi:hypothetical protein